MIKAILEWLGSFIMGLFSRVGRAEQSRDDWQKTAETLAAERDEADKPLPSDEEIRKKMREGL